MSSDSKTPTALAEDSIVPQILEILQGHGLFPDGLGDPVFGGPRLARYLDLHNEVSLYLRRERSTEPVGRATLAIRDGHEILSIEECIAINTELDELMEAEGRIG